MPEKDVLADLIVKLGTDATDFKTGIQDSIGALTGLSSSAVATGGIIAGALAAIGVAAFNVGVEFDSAFDTIAAKTGETGTSLAGLQESFKSVFATVPVDAAAAAEAIAGINTKLDLTGAPLEALATDFLDLTRVLNEDLGGAITAATTAFNAWDVSAPQEALNQLFVAAQNSGTSVTSLAQQVGQAGPILQQFGLSFSESVALIAQLGLSGDSASTALAGLKVAVANLTEKGIPARDALGAIFDAIKNAPTDLAATQAAIDTFGTRAGPELAQKIRTGKLDFDEMLTRISSAKDAIKQTADSTDDFGEKWKTFTNSLKVAFEPVGTFLVDSLTTLVGSLNSVNQAHKKWFDDVAAAGAPFRESMGTFFSDLSGQLSGFIEGLGTQVTNFKTTFSDTWTGLATGVRTTWNSLWTGIQTAFTNATTPITNAVSGFTSKVEGAFQALKNVVVGNSIVPDMVSDITAEFGKLGGSEASSALSKTNDGLGAIEGAFSTFKTNVGTITSNLLSSLISGEGSFAEKAKAAFGALKDSILNIASEQVMGVFNTALDGLLTRLPGLEKLGGIFGGGGGGGVSIPGTGGGGSVPGGGGGGVAGAGSGLAGTLTAVGSIGSLISGVIGNFQNAKMETTLNAIEESTRRATLFLGDRADGGILGVSFRILEQLEFGNLVKATEDLRNKFWDYGVPELRAMNANTAALMPVLQMDADHSEAMLDRLDRIDRNTRLLAPIEQNTRAGSRGTAGQLDELKTAIDQNRDGIATTIARVSRGR